MKKILCNLDLAAAAVAFVVLIIVTFGGVIMRYLISQPIIWAEEVQLWCFLWITFLGAGAAFRYGSHVAVEIVFEMLPSSLKKIVAFVDFLIVMAVLGYLIFLGFDLLALMVKIGKVTSILRVPLWFINAIIPLGCALMMISAVYAYYLDVTGKRAKETKED